MYSAKEEDDYEDEDEEEESNRLILSIGEDGKATLEKESDYISVYEKDMKLVKEFLDENKELFSEWLKKKDNDLKLKS